MRMTTTASLFAVATILLAATPSSFGQFNQIGAGAGAGGQTGGQASFGGLGTAANANSLLNATSSTNTFSGFTQSFGSGNIPFGTGNLNLNGNATTGIGTLAGAGNRAGVGGLGGAAGGTGTQGFGGGGIGGLGGGLGGIGGGLGGGLGGFGGGLGGLGGGFGGLGGIGGRGGFGGGLGGLGGGSFGGGRGGLGGNQALQSAIRTRLRPMLSVAPVAHNHVAARVQANLARINLPARYANVQVSVEGRRAILLGVVDTVEDVRFLTRLLSLEPGIDSVESRLEPSSPVEIPETVQPSPNP